MLMAGSHDIEIIEGLDLVAEIALTIPLTGEAIHSMSTSSSFLGGRVCCQLSITLNSGVNLYLACC
jgi:hypothetical protein